MLYGHNEDIDITFYNDRVKEVIAEEGFTNPFSFVPIKASQMEVVSGKSGNAIVFGGITEGYDPIPIAIATKVQYRDISLEGGMQPLLVVKMEISRTYWDFNDPQNPFYNLSPCIEIKRGYYVMWSFILNEGAEFFFTLKGHSTASVAVGGGDTGVTMRDKIKSAIETSWGTHYQGMPTVSNGPSDMSVSLLEDTLRFQGGRTPDAWPEISEADIFPHEFYAYILDGSMTSKVPSLKYGATHDFGVVYKDSVGRRSSVIKSEDTSIYLPFYCEKDNVLVNTVADLTFEINHIPPAWADSYEIVYAGNASMDYWLQIRIDSIISLTGSQYLINIQSNLDWSRTQNRNWRVPDYIFRSGDRIRLIGVIADNNGAVTEYTTVQGQVYDYEILGTSDETGEEISGEWLIIQAIDRPNPFDNAQNILAEIYRPKKGLGVSYYHGTGMAFNIGIDANGYRYHMGDEDQVISASGAPVTPAKVHNTANDSWKYSRISYVKESPTAHTFFAESIAPSDWWEDQTRLTSQGWPFLLDITQKQNTLDARLRHGGFLYEGTRINNMAWFTYDGFVDLPQKFGRVTGLREIGYTLKVLQMHKESSIYLQRVQTFSADGGEGDYSLVNNLLGTVRPMETDYGCQNPDSILVSGRHLYYWDGNEGKYIRSSPNGQIPISDYKMNRWFKELNKWIGANRSRGMLVNSGANISHEEIWVTWSIDKEVKGLIFSERHNRWISRIDQPADTYVHLGSWFASILRQRLYIQNVDEGQRRLSWAGVDTEALIQFVSNVNVLKNKVFNSVALYADDQFVCFPGDIVIPEEASYAKMESYIAVWNKSEGIYYGRILKDMNSPGNWVSENHKTMSGREMRGRYCLIRLHNSRHDRKVRMFSAMILSVDSERSS